MHLRSFKVYPPYHSGRDNAPRPVRFPTFSRYFTFSRARPIQKKCKRHLSSPRLSAPSASFLLARCWRLCWREEPCSGILWPEVAGNPASDILNALYIGTKFDIRMVVLGLIPIALILGIPPLERLLVRSRGFRGLIDLLYAAVFAAATLVYIIDFGWFFYMHTRVDASLFELLGDPDIAGTMVWETYPVVWITFGLIVVTALYALFFGKTLARHEATPRLGWKGRTGWSVATFVILFLLGYGQISSNLFPLRWSNAFFSVDKNISILALNPIQNLFDTVNAARGTRPDIEATRESYPRVAAWLRVPNPDPQKLDFMRTVPGTPAERQEKPLNVVVIIMESMTWPRTSFSPNLTGIPEDTTPNLMALSKDSLYYPLFFAPTRTTARAIFTTMTGIPDVNRSGGTSSRNQALVDQALMMNEFKGYSKYYMIGGSASWANIRGFLSHNIEGLHLLEEGSWKAPNTDVWGLSDLDLFREAAAALTKSPKPFVAVIQTAGFHRPYTIPEDNAGFQIKQPSEAILKNYGFTGADEYNSLRFSDHSLGEFFKIARQQPWFDNTVFAIFGDHGLNDTSLNMSPGYLACRLQSNHTPMLIYAPGLVAAGKLQPGVDGRRAASRTSSPRWRPSPESPTATTRWGGTSSIRIPSGMKCSSSAGKPNPRCGLWKTAIAISAKPTNTCIKWTPPYWRICSTRTPNAPPTCASTHQDFYNVSKYLLYNNKKFD